MEVAVGRRDPAAVGVGRQTRYAHLEGLPYRHPTALRALRPLLRRIIAIDVSGITRALRWAKTLPRLAVAGGGLARCHRRCPLIVLTDEDASTAGVGR